MTCPEGVINGRRVRFTWHALERALDMCVRETDLLDVLADPRKTIVDGGGEVMVLGRKLALACVDDSGVLVVKTVLWRRDKDWKSDLSRGSYGGRTYCPKGA